MKRFDRLDMGISIGMCKVDFNYDNTDSKNTLEVTAIRTSNGEDLVDFLDIHAEVYNILLNEF